MRKYPHIHVFDEALIPLQSFASAVHLAACVYTFYPLMFLFKSKRLIFITNHDENASLYGLGENINLVTIWCGGVTFGFYSAKKTQFHQFLEIHFGNLLVIIQPFS